MDKHLSLLGKILVGESAIAALIAFTYFCRRYSFRIRGVNDTSALDKITDPELRRRIEEKMAASKRGPSENS
jgi:hypothetical protein